MTLKNILVYALRVFVMYPLGTGQGASAACGILGRCPAFGAGSWSRVGASECEPCGQADKSRSPWAAYEVPRLGKGPEGPAMPPKGRLLSKLFLFNRFAVDFDKHFLATFQK